VSDRDRALRALILQHEQPTPAGLILDWLGDRGIGVEHRRVDIDERIALGDHDLIVSLGSEFAAFDDHIPWIPQEAGLLDEALRRDAPVLGVCFGAQLMTRVLGGRCYRSEESEIGWLPVRTTDPDLVPEGPWFQWHFDSFELPPGATLLADSPAGPQAFLVNRSLGVQFHPEVTPRIMDEWVREYRHELDAEGVDPDGLVRETRERDASNRERAWRLLDRWLAGVAGFGAVAGRAQ
jgi:GMP synthase-like glutamine amidotransferase